MAAKETLTYEQALERIAVLEETMRALNKENLQLLKDLTDKREPPPQPPPPPVCPCMTAAPDGYTPPNTLDAAQRDAKHFRAASLMHLGTIEEQKREIDGLRIKLHGTKGKPDQYTRKLETALEVLKADTARLTSELQAASDAWREYQGRAHAAPHFFRWGQYWQRQALGSTQLSGPGLPIQGRRFAPIVG